MHKATYDKLNLISPGLLAPFGCLTTPFTQASAHVSTQSIGSSLANDIQELDVSKVNDSSQATNLHTLWPTQIRTNQRSDLSKTLSLLPSVRIDNALSSSNQQDDVSSTKFSIRVAVPYQDNIQSNNASIDMSLKSAQKVRPRQILSRTQSEEYSQAAFIAQHFINTINTISTNTAVVEGGFTGSVVQAKKTSNLRQNEFGLSHRVTKSSGIEFHIDEYLLTASGEVATHKVTGISGKFHPNFDRTQTSISGAMRIGGLDVFDSLSEKRSEITQKRAPILAIPRDLAYFLGTDTFTCIDGLQYLNLMGSDEKTVSDTYEVQEQGYALSWNLSLLYGFETDFDTPCVCADLINVSNSENIMRFEADSQLFAFGGQYTADIGHEF